MASDRLTSEVVQLECEQPDCENAPAWFTAEPVLTALCDEHAELYGGADHLKPISELEEA